MPRIIKAQGWEKPEATAEDLALAKAGKKRKDAGKQPTKAQHFAMERVAKIEDDRLRHDIYATIPKRHWAEMSGRQNKILDDQAARYGLPVNKPVISLHEVVAWLHEFLATHAVAIAFEKGTRGSRKDDPLEKLKAEKLAIQIAVMNRELVPVDEFRDNLEPFCASMRRAGETLRRVFGEDAARVLDDALDDSLQKLAIALEVDSDAS